MKKKYIGYIIIMVSGSFVKDSESWVLDKWQNRVVQLSVYAGVVFYIVANPSVFKFMESLLPSKISNMNQLLLHSVLFSVLMYVGTRMFFDPILSQVGLL